MRLLRVIKSNAGVPLIEVMAVVWCYGNIGVVAVEVSTKPLMRSMGFSMLISYEIIAIFFESHQPHVMFVEN